MGVRLPNLTAILRLDDKFSKSLRQAASSLKQVGADITTVGRRLSAGITLPLAGAATAATKFATDFQASLSQIEGLVGLSAEQVGQLRQGILALGPAVGKGPGELADAMFFITSAGARGQTALDLLQASAKAAAAGLGETATVADAATSALNAYGEENLNAGDAVGVLVAAVREGKASAETIAPVLGRVIPIAAELGVSFDQVAASIAAMTRLGASADEAATSLRATLASMLKPGADAEKALMEVGLSSQALRRQLGEQGLFATLQTLRRAFRGNTEELARVFPNIRALTGVLNLVGKNAGTTAEIMQSLARAGVGDLDRAFGVAAQTARFRLNQALSVLRTSAIRLGDALLPVVIPAIRTLAGAVTLASQKFQQLAPSTQRMVLVGGALAAVVGPLTVAFGLFVSSLGSVVSVAVSAVKSLKIVGLAFGLLTSPVGLAVVAIAGLAAAFFVFRDEVTGVLRKIAERVREFLVVNFQNAVEALKAPIQRVVDFFRSLLGKIVELVRKVAPSLVDGIDVAAEAAIDFGKAVGDGVNDGLKNAADATVDFAGKVVDRIDAMKASLRGLAGAAQAAIPDLAGSMEMAGEVAAATTPRIQTFGAQARGAALVASEAFTDMADSVESSISRFVEDLGRGEARFEDFVQSILGGIRRIFAQEAAEGIVGAVLGSKDPTTGKRGGGVLGSILDKIPFLGEGGIALRPAIAGIGDVPEAIIPLDRLDELGGDDVNLEVRVINNGQPMDVREFFEGANRIIEIAAAQGAAQGHARVVQDLAFGGQVRDGIRREFAVAPRGRIR